MLGVALLVAGLAAPAGAKKGPPSGGGLKVTVEPSSLAWANSVGDEIKFDITVTNRSGGDLTGVTVTFSDTEVGAFDLAKNASWPAEGPEVYEYKVVGSIGSGSNTGDFQNAPISTSTDVTVGTVTATGTDANGQTVTDNDDAVMTAYPVLPCDGTVNEGFYTTVRFGQNADYSECSFTPDTPAYWTFTTTLATPKKGRGPKSPSATVRDGIPGNWCNYDENGPIPQGDSGDPTVVIDENYFPASGICLHGGAGGDTIAVRNTDTFYLATWAGNRVKGTPLDES